MARSRGVTTDPDDTVGAVPETSAGSSDDAPTRELARVDTWWAFATATLAAIVFATTFSSSVALGDAPEGVSGIHSLGVLHAPGYPSYVLLGRIFTTILP